MTVQSTTSRNDYTANGGTASYSYAFRITDPSELLVTVATNVSPITESQLVLNTDYTVSGVGAAAGGTVTLINNSQSWLNGGGDLTSGYTITIRRTPLLEQLSSFRDMSTFYPSDFEDALDYIVFQIQSLWDRLRHAPKFRESSTAWDDTQMPDLVPNSLLGVNSSGTGLTMVVNGVPTPATSGTESVGISVVAGTSIPINPTALDQIIFVAGAGGVVMSANPQITAGTIIGQKLTLIGTDNTNFVTLVGILNDTNGTSINGPITLGKRTSIDFRWSGSVWTETARREN